MKHPSFKVNQYYCGAILVEFSLVGKVSRLTAYLAVAKSSFKGELLHLPTNVVELSLSRYNSHNPFAAVKFPDHLEVLRLGDGFRKVARLPTKLRKLEVGHAFKADFNKADFPPELSEVLVPTYKQKLRFGNAPARIKVHTKSQFSHTFDDGMIGF